MTQTIKRYPTSSDEVTQGYFSKRIINAAIDYHKKFNKSKKVIDEEEILKRKYSRVHVTKNPVDNIDNSNSLVGFSYNIAKTHLKRNLEDFLETTEFFRGSVKLVKTIATPFVFGYYMVSGNLKYKNPLNNVGEIEDVNYSKKK